MQLLNCYTHGKGCLLSVPYSGSTHSGHSGNTFCSGCHMEIGAASTFFTVPSLVPVTIPDAQWIHDYVKTWLSCPRKFQSWSFNSTFIAADRSISWKGSNSEFLACLPLCFCCMVLRLLFCFVCETIYGPIVVHTTSHFLAFPFGI